MPYDYLVLATGRQFMNMYINDVDGAEHVRSRTF